MTLLQDGVTWFAGKMKTSAGRTVALVRGGVESAEFTAWVTTETHSTKDTSGLLVQVRSRNYKCLTSDLPYTPKRTDYIRETVNSTEYDFEVMPMSGETETAWVDHDGNITVIRCKEIGIGS